MKSVVIFSLTASILVVLTAAIVGGPPASEGTPSPGESDSPAACCADQGCSLESAHCRGENTGLHATSDQKGQCKSGGCASQQLISKPLNKPSKASSDESDHAACTKGKCSEEQCSEDKCSEDKCSEEQCHGGRGCSGGGQCAEGEVGAQAGLQKAAKSLTAGESATKGCPHCSGDECKESCDDCKGLQKDAGAGKSAEPGKTAMRRPGPGHAHDDQHRIDHEDFFFLIEHKESIRRTIKNLPNGIETVTESDKDEVAAKIQKHVESMYNRVENVNPIRMRDPLFREIFANAKKIEMEFENTKHGVRVKETSEDPYVVKLLQSHAKVVSKFIKNGYSELPKNHLPPKR